VKWQPSHYAVSCKFSVVVCRQGGYVFASVCLSVSRITKKKCRRAWNLFGGVGCVSSNKWLGFGCDPDQGILTEFFYNCWTAAIVRISRDHRPPRVLLVCIFCHPEVDNFPTKEERDSARLVAISVFISRRNCMVPLIKHRRLCASGTPCDPCQTR